MPPKKAPKKTAKQKEEEKRNWLFCNTCRSRWGRASQSWGAWAKTSCWEGRTREDCWGKETSWRGETPRRGSKTPGWRAARC